MPKKETVSNYVVYGLGVAIIVVSLVAVLFAFSINSKINTPTSNNSNSNSNSNTGLLTVSNLVTSDVGYGTVDFSGIVHNEENTYAYHSQLHVIGIYQNGTKALDTYIIIGNQGVMAGNEYYTFDTGVLSYSYQANYVTPQWTVTAAWTTSP